MREIAEIELAIQGGTEKIETLGKSLVTLWCLWMLICRRRAREGGRVDEGDAGHRGTEKRERGERGVQMTAVFIYARILTMDDILLLA